MRRTSAAVSDLPSLNTRIGPAASCRGRGARLGVATRNHPNLLVLILFSPNSFDFALSNQGGLTRMDENWG